jgi:hypothetical protein
MYFTFPYFIPADACRKLHHLSCSYNVGLNNEIQPQIDNVFQSLKSVSAVALPLLILFQESEALAALKSKGSPYSSRFDQLTGPLCTSRHGFPGEERFN